MTYTVVLLRTSRGRYVVRVPALRGCVTEGDNLADALDNAREAMQAYTESLRMENEPIPGDVRRVELDDEDDEALILRLRVPEASV